MDRDRCAEVARLLSDVRIRIQSNRCADGGVGTQHSEVRDYGAGTIASRLEKGCVYDVLVEVGDIDKSKIYYSNSKSSEANLVLPANAADMVYMKIVLQTTPEGAAVGFPIDQPIITEDAADLEIEARFGTRSSKRVDFAEVNVILKAKCSPCHALGGPNPLFVDNPTEFKKKAEERIPYIENDLMPPPDTRRYLTPDEKETLLRYWKKK